MKHVTFSLVVGLLMPALAVALDYPPTDHGGADLVLADGDTIWGEHANIGRFTIPAGATVRVREYDPASPERGSVRVVAREIVIAGTLDAKGSGYTGSGGGGAGCAAYFDCFSFCCGCAYAYQSSGGSGRYAGFGGASGTGCVIIDYACGPSPLCGNGSSGGPSRGDGSFGGTWAWNNTVADDGGYVMPARSHDLTDNGDSSTDESIVAGSGGSGTSGQTGYALGGYTGQGGDAGGCGGGVIALVAGARLDIQGSLLASGTKGGAAAYSQNGSTDGANSWPPGDSETGYGAGGGILLKLEPGATATFGPDGRIESLSGGGYPSNGGSLKLAGSFPLIPSDFEVSVGNTIAVIPPPSVTWLVVGPTPGTKPFADGVPTRSREEDEQ